MNKRSENVDTSTDLLTVKEAAAFLRLRASTLYVWIERRQIPFVRLGTQRIRLRRSDLQAFIEGGIVAAKTSGLS